MVCQKNFLAICNFVKAKNVKYYSWQVIKLPGVSVFVEEQNEMMLENGILEANVFVLQRFYLPHTVQQLFYG